MKSNRRKFIQNLGVGAAGITLGSSTIDLPVVQNDPDREARKFLF